MEIHTYVHAHTRANERMGASGAKAYDEMPIYGRIIINVMDYVLHNTCRVLFVFVLQIEYQLRTLRPNQPKQLVGKWRFLGLHLRYRFPYLLFLLWIQWIGLSLFLRCDYILSLCLCPMPRCTHVQCTL